MPETNDGKSTRGLKEHFAKFLENPTREGLREIIQNHLGETKNLDFKEAWESHSKMAKHLLGFANSIGGCVILGISQKADNGFDPIGLAKFEDKADIIKGIQKYLPNKIAFEIFDFAYEESEYPKIKGKKFQILLIQDNPKFIPFVSRVDGDGIRQNTVYIRRQGETMEANYDELQEVINRRVETQYSSKIEKELENSLAELKVLYDCIPQKVESYELEIEQYMDLRSNPEYPREGFEAFIRKLIAFKKERITEMVTKRYQVK